MWAELPHDVLREIFGRLHAASDLVRFHAVCKPWRDTATATTTRQPLLPLLLAQDKMYSISVRLRCVFSRTSYSARPPFSIGRRNWVASEDGTSIWYLAQRPSPSLRDPLTGAVTLLLPSFPQEHGWEDSPNGMVYSDGTVLLYTLSGHGDTVKFKAALLRPGDAIWTVEKRTFESSEECEFCVAYHRGTILITVDGPVATLNVEFGAVQVLTLPRPLMPGELDHDFYVCYYVLESRGELLCVSVYARPDYPDEFGGTIEEAAAGPEKMRWVSKDGRSLADRVFFLGWPSNFAVDASRISGDAVSGGCAYFVYKDLEAIPNQPFYVFRYNMVNGKAKFVEQLPQGWDDMCTWLFPRPSIAPVEEIIGRLEGRKWWKMKKKVHMASTTRSNIYIERPQPPCYNPYFRMFVRNIPRTVDSFQLQQFFSKYGKVATAKVMRKRKNKIRKIGIVTIAMVEELEDALAALDGLIFNGCVLEVR
ncbi:F-box protein At2g17036-like [Lolium perenne]|uniref:F-box protein At2g17036-like n=1 Tax=Lolium perenne TaxID=4522 RepID=UPI003A99BDB8